MSVKRKPISKKNRFDIFKRDLFICQYCGNTPPAVILEVDHITPVSKGGDNSVDNLITACFDCNRGTAANELTVTPDTILEKSKIISEKEEQIKEYKKILKRKKSRQSKDIQYIQEIFRTYYPDSSFTDTFVESFRINFIEKLTLDVLEASMHIACCKFPDKNMQENAGRYFCGICWNRIRELSTEDIR